MLLRRVRAGGRQAGNVGDRHAAEAVLLDPVDRARFLDVRMLEIVGVVVDPLAEHVLGLQDGDPFLGGLGRHRLVQRLDDLGRVLDAVVVALQVGIVGDVLAADQLEQQAEVMRPHGAHHDVAVLRLVAAGRHVEHRRRALGEHPFHQLGALEGGGRAHQAGIDVAALAEAELAHQRRRQRLEGVEAGRDVDGDHALTPRRAVRHPVHHHHAAEGLDQPVDGRPLAVGARLAEARHRAVDDLGIDLLDVLVAEAQPLDHARPEALHHDMRLGGDLLHHGDAVGRLEVERDRALAAVEGDGMGAVVALQLAQRAAPVAFQRLDLDDVGAVQGEQHGGVRPRDALREVENGDAVVSALDHCSPLLPTGAERTFSGAGVQGPPCREAMRSATKPMDDGRASRRRHGRACGRARDPRSPSRSATRAGWRRSPAGCRRTSPMPAGSRLSPLRQPAINSRGARILASGPSW